MVRAAPGQAGRVAQVRCPAVPDRGREPSRRKSVLDTALLIAVPALLGILVSNTRPAELGRTRGVISVDAIVRNGAAAKYGIAATVIAGTGVTIRCAAGKVRE